MNRERYVVVTHTPFQWSSGRSAHFYDSLEDAQKSAEYDIARSTRWGTEGYIEVSIGLVTLLNGRDNG